METALIFLIWALFVGVIVLIILGGIHLSARTDRVISQAESIREDTKQRREGKR